MPPRPPQYDFDYEVRLDYDLRLSSIVCPVDRTVLCGYYTSLVSLVSLLRERCGVAWRGVGWRRRGDVRCTCTLHLYDGTPYVSHTPQTRKVVNCDDTPASCLDSDARDTDS